MGRAADNEAIKLGRLGLTTPPSASLWVAFSPILTAIYGG